MNVIWQAIAREAALAAEHMGLGVTALGKANYAHNAHYPQAFFALSTGLERTAKLALVIDYAIQNGGTFPDNQQLRRFGHNLKQLLDAVDAIATSGRLTDKVRCLPRTPIHNSIIDVLSDFASNITRYYNLDLVTNAPGVQQKSDPIASWFSQVIEPAIAKHVTGERKAKIERNAKLIDEMMGRSAKVIHHSETGQPLETVCDASQMTGLIGAVQPHVRLYVLQIVRFLASVMTELTYKTYEARLEDVPHLSEFFAIYNNEDKLLKGRKTWSIYKP